MANYILFGFAMFCALIAGGAAVDAWGGNVRVVVFGCLVSLLFGIDFVGSRIVEAIKAKKS